MVKKYSNIRIETEVLNQLSECEKEYRSHHPEFEGLFLPKSKILREIIKFYLKN